MKRWAIIIKKKKLKIREDHHPRGRAAKSRRPPRSCCVGLLLQIKSLFLLLGSHFKAADTWRDEAGGWVEGGRERP